MIPTWQRTRNLIAALAVIGLGSVAAADDAATKTIDPRDYRRAQPKPPALRRAPQRAPLPADLRIAIAAPKSAPSSALPAEVGKKRPGSGQQGHGPAPDRADRGRPEVGQGTPDARLATIEARARAEARWVAELLVAERGRVEYYRVGFHNGMDAALRDPAFGRYEFGVGLRAGTHSVRAEIEGRAFGEALADERARIDAVEAVEAQFTDLGREPRYLSAPAAPYVELDPPALAAPTVYSVMRDHPIAVFQGAFGPRHGMLADWGWNAQRLYDARDHHGFFDAKWRDPSRAFDWWARHRPAALRRLRGQYERAIFTAAFRQAFGHYVARLHWRELERAYDAGLDDGWSYGAFVGEELHYRLGYRHGFGEAFVEAGERSFARAYRDAWAAAYDAGFDDWSRNARPAIARAHLVDDNDDGIFEPGEGFHVVYQVVNYGGAAASVPVGLYGGSLRHEPRGALDLPARTATTAVLESAAFRPGVRPRTQARLTLEVAGERHRLSVAVRRPLQFVPSSLRLERDNLAGRLHVEIAVENVSSRPVAGDVAVHATSTGFYESHGLPTLGAGASRRVGFVVDDLAPLDLLAGKVWLRFELDRRGFVQDEQRHVVNEVATDLRNRDLLLYLSELAMGSPFAATDLERARRLMLDRLRADWRRAVEASGNPYKRDLKRSGRETALGELVTTWASDRDRMARPEVFAGMSGDIVALARDLPGLHPMLRKSMRRLASTLP